MIIPKDIRLRINKILGTEKWSLHLTADLRHTRMSIKTSGGAVVASANLSRFPGCCGIVVSYHALVDYLYCGRGLGTILNKLRISWAREQGYTVLMCTDRSDNEAQRAILKRNGWKDMFRFTNKRGGNQVAVSYIKLG